jgi:tol-pal system protein YbgF
MTDIVTSAAPRNRTPLFIRLALPSALLLTSLAHAAIPVESHALSKPVAAAAVSAAADSGQASQLYQLTQQINKLQDEVRSLRGKVEDQDNDIDTIKKETKNRYTDFDQRLAQLQGGATGGAAVAAPSSTTGSSSATPATTPAPTTAAPAGDEADKTAYIAAYEAYKTGGASQAIAPMKDFIARYPQSPYVPNAYYWLGEFNLAVNPPNFTAAASNFRVVYNQYPKSAKAAAATYRLATLADVDQKRSTAIELMQNIVKNYPGTQEAGFAASFLKSHPATTPATTTTKPVTHTATTKPAVTKSETSTSTTTTSKPVVKKHVEKALDKNKYNAIIEEKSKKAKQAAAAKDSDG